MPNWVSSIVICLLALLRVRIPAARASICSDRSSRALAVILLGGRRNSRISAGKERPLADNFLQIQQSGGYLPRLASRGSRCNLLDRTGVEVVEPAQGVGRAVGGSLPFGVAGLLRRAVAQVEAGLVGARHVLQSGDA